MARRQSKPRRQGFPRSNIMTHAFVDALVDAERRDVNVREGIQASIVRGVKLATRSK